MSIVLECARMSGWGDGACGRPDVNLKRPSKVRAKKRIWSVAPTSERQVNSAAPATTVSTDDTGPTGLNYSRSRASDLVHPFIVAVDLTKPRCSDVLRAE